MCTQYHGHPDTDYQSTQNMDPLWNCHDSKVIHPGMQEIVKVRFDCGYACLVLC